MGDLTDSQATPSPTPATSTAARNPRLIPVREDCWSEDATFTLIEAWGKHYVDLNRGNLRQKHWQEVSDAVNAFHAGFDEKVRRSDVQCKNRIDTLKKKYKIEKARVLESRGSYQSSWPFFAPLDSLIGSAPSAPKRPSPAAVSHSSLFLPAASVAMSAHQAAGGRTGPLMAVPLLPQRRTPPPAGLATVVPQKRPSPAFTAVDASYPDIRKNYSSMAAAAAAAVSDDEEVEEEEEEEDLDLDDSIPNRERGEAEGMRKLAGAIERFAEVYERVEADKQRQIVELEKQRMQFVKELECQRMQMLVEMQVQLEKVKRLKR